VTTTAAGGIPPDVGAAMRSGAMYNDLDERLVMARAAAVRRSDAFNATVGAAPEVRLQALRELVAAAGAGTFLEPTFRCEFGVNIRLGQRFYANFDCVMLDGADITIGDDVLFGPRVSLYTANHALDPAERRAGACYARPITIGDAVWIAGGVTVLPGVTIGDGAVIGAGSVVTRDVPPAVVAVGSPARAIRTITEADRTGFVG
jgi:maltose O-acetyltransferase